MTASPADLAAFATALAQHLPGQWCPTHERFPPPQDHRSIADHVWDRGPANSAVLDFPDSPIQLLEGPDDAQLCVIERPRYPRQYLVAPLEPESFKPHHFRMVDEPNGIAVPNYPVRAAAAITRRVLPRYRQALDAVRHNARTQPEPPHRPPAPDVAQTLTLIWYPDGVVGAPYKSVPEDARMVLYGCRFQYSPHESAFVLPASYSAIDRALFIQSAARLLTAQGIGVNFRHAAPASAGPPTRPPTAAPGTQPTAGRPSSARR
ncbi:hypothetical protein CTU88_14195 [Streptomyces sp. JV178]|uniref:hypothetical protein n=1 Tax=Streptomyces sp. JV178 TaxID=858632 RepID=UPI000C1B237A|nr:hypothetical protein [Streptomyces sp. JV178]PIM71275.1 hypothetical protein CTU88_14195 [Streptomyces sp. JV178]